MFFSAPDNREEESTRRRMSDSTLREPRNAYYVQRYARDDEDDRRGQPQRVLLLVGLCSRWLFSRVVCMVTLIFRRP